MSKYLPALYHTAKGPMPAVIKDIEPFLQAGTGAIPRTYQDKMRESVSVKDFGAVGDGVTDDSASIAAAIASGTNVYFPAGNYRISTSLQITKQNARLYGDGNASRIFSDTLVTPVKLVSITNLVFEDLFFETTATGASVYGVVYSDGDTLSNVTFSRCKFSAQLANTNGFKAINEGANIADRIAFVGCEFLNIGRMGIEFQNHNNLDTVYRYKRVTIDRCYFKNIGLLETHGMGVSLSGYGEQCYVTNNGFDNCWTIGIEGVGVKDSVFDGNTFSGFSTRSYQPFSFSGSRPMPGLSIRNNKVDGSNAGRWNLYNVSNCVVSGNLLRSGYFFIRDTSDALFKDNFIYQKASDPYSIYLEGVCARNRFTANYLDGSLSTVANQGTVFHNNTGLGITDTVYQDCRIIKSPYSAALTGTTVGNTRVENCDIDGVLYAHLSPVGVRKGTLQIPSVSGVSKLTIDGFTGPSWTTRIIRFTVHGIATDSTGRVAASRQIEVRGQGTNTPVVGGTATIFESGCTISYDNTSQTLVIVCTNTASADAVHRWEYEIVGAAVGEVSVST